MAADHADAKDSQSATNLNVTIGWCFFLQREFANIPGFSDGWARYRVEYMGDGRTWWGHWRTWWHVNVLLLFGLAGEVYRKTHITSSLSIFMEIPNPFVDTLPLCNHSYPLNASAKWGSNVASTCWWGNCPVVFLIQIHSRKTSWLVGN